MQQITPVFRHAPSLLLVERFLRLLSGQSWLVNCLVGLLVSIVFTGLFPSPAYTDELEYFYDEVGRLVQTTNTTAGTAVIYSYDAAGNITAQAKKQLNTLGISGFTPDEGPAGTDVEVTGTGFSATSVVKFNGAVATVIGSAATRLVVTVPIGAATGAISVSNGTTTVNASSPFHVVASANVPAISGFSPTVGTSGTQVIVSGINFDPLARNNKLVLNSTPVQVISASPTSLVTVVPPEVLSGKFHVITPIGVATSTNDFFVSPSGYQVGSIGSTGRIAVGVTGSVSLTAGAVALRVFDGNVGDYLTLGVSGVTVSACAVKVFRPDGGVLAVGNITGNGQGIQLPKLPITGTYTIVVDPGLNSGSIDIEVFPPIREVVAIDGPTVDLALILGQRAVLSFSGTTGKYASLSLSNVSLAAGIVSLFDPKGSLLMSSQFDSGGKILQPILPMDGAYSVLIEPSGPVSGTVSVGLSSTPPPVLMVNQASHLLVLQVGKGGEVSFSATAGQYLALGVTERLGAINGATITVIAPDGSVEATTSFNATYSSTLTAQGYSGSAVANLGPLSHSGTYTVLVQQKTAGSGTLELTLSSPVTGSMTVGGGARLTAGRAGQPMQVTFTGAVGQYLALGVEEILSAISQGSSISKATIRVLAPDGALVATKAFSATYSATLTMSGYSGNTVVNLGPLTQSGTYTVLVQQTTAGTGTLQLTLSSPVTGAMTVGGGGQHYGWTSRTVNAGNVYRGGRAIPRLRCRRDLERDQSRILDQSSNYYRSCAGWNFGGDEGV